MEIRHYKKEAGATLLLLTLAGCGGGNDPDPKLSPPSINPSSSTLSGVVLDGYLYKANVCIDRNDNAFCDAADGVITQTDNRGRYELEIGDGADGLTILVEAVPGVTIDMDSPDQTVTKAFTLETPSASPQVVSPMTSMISSLAETSGVSFDQAAINLADDLNVTSTVIKSDYVAGSSQQSREVHMLARGITRVMQEAQQESVDSGVSQSDARKGSIQRLASLDVAGMKQRTDQISDGASNTDEVLDQLASDYRDDVKINPDEIKDGKIQNVPRAPKNGVVNDTADTFDWSFVLPHNNASDYEYSTDNGQNWQAVTEKPINVGENAYAKGSVQVRVKAQPENDIASGKALKSDKAYTETEIPAAPASLTVNDAANSFDWQYSPGFTQSSAYEYTIDGGTHWLNVSSKPQPVADIAIAAGQLKLRVKANAESAQPAGLTVKSTVPMTVTPATPVAPTLNRIDDDSDILLWNYVSGFENPQGYEINLGSAWQDVTAHPYQIGDVNIAANTIKIRVKADANTGRQAGAVLTVSGQFTKAKNKPVAPTNPSVNDAGNLFGWTIVTGYSNASDYEYSTNGGISFQDSSANPQPIPDSNFAIGAICVRVKAAAENETGSSLCSDKVFSETPPQPASPSNGQVNDAQNTFNWDWVSGFTNPSDYELRIESGSWQTVSAKPVIVEDRDYAIGDLEVRVKSDPVTGRLAGQILSNQVALTKQPDAPVAPSGLVVDDSADTLDWSFVSGFDGFAFYEWSLDSGSNWSPVTAKPINVGDIAKSAGEIKLRVKANSSNGMPAGAAALTADAFTKVPALPAPASGTLTNADKIKNNGFGWANVTAAIASESVEFDQPSHYEFTVDKGATWTTAKTNPQFVGPQAYDKANVGVRLKENAIDGKTNRTGDVLWATGISGQFEAIKYVPMNTYDRAADFSTSTFSGNGWSTYNMNCIAEYDDEGKGEPLYWANDIGYYENKRDDIFPDIAKLSACGIEGWSLVTATEVATLSARGADTLPSHISSDLINDSQRLWADDNGNLVTYQNGVVIPVPDYYRVYAFPKWKLADSASLLSKVTSELSVIKSHVSSQDTEISGLESFLTTWVSEDKSKSKAYSVLATEAESKRISLSATKALWDTEKAAVDKKLTNFLFEAKMAANRSDSDANSFITKVAEYQAQAALVAENGVALQAGIEASSFANKLALIQQNSDEMTSADSTLSSASAGQAIHQATMAFYQALAIIEADHETVEGLKNKLADSNSALVDRFSVLSGLLTSLTTEMTTVVNLHDVDSLHNTAVDGLNRANTAGYVVSEADALIDGRFAKLDILGRYMPKATSFAQGWRCVLDTDQGSKKRVWTLLKDGLPKGKDDLAYDAAGSGKPSLLGAGGYLENANSKNYCGYNDWIVPHTAHLTTLPTATVLGVSSPTLDVNVFPNHRALNPDYDKSTSSGGVHFYYWSSVSHKSYSDRQYVIKYATTYSGNTSRDYYSSNPSSSDTRAILARLVRETPTSWVYLDTDGNTVSDRSSAVCAKNADNGEIWQLFQNATESERYKKLAEANTLIGTMNTNSTCGKSNWALPTKAQMLGLIPVNSTVFLFNDVPTTDFYNEEKYLAAESTSSRIHYVDFKEGTDGDTYHSSFDLYLYRAFSK